MPDITFTVLAAAAVATAILALEAREIVYGAVSLAVMLLTMAGFFILLDAPFVAMFQIIVYVGAIAVLIIFTVMLVRRERWIEVRDVYMQTWGVLAALILAAVVGIILFQSSLNRWVAGDVVVPIGEIGKVMVSNYWAALEVLALLLAASLAGAITIAKLDRDE